jgi:hypothetical protein
MFAAFNERDIDALIAYFDPQIEFHSTQAGIARQPESGPKRILVF